MAIENRLEQVMLDWSARHGVRLTLKMLAEATGISDKVLSKIANGQKKGLADEQLDLLCEALECTPNDILAYRPNFPRRTTPLSEIAKANPITNPVTPYDAPHQPVLKPHAEAQIGR